VIEYKEKIKNSQSPAERRDFFLKMKIKSKRNNRLFEYIYSGIKILDTSYTKDVYRAILEEVSHWNDDIVNCIIQKFKIYRRFCSLPKKRANISGNHQSILLLFGNFKRNVDGIILLPTSLEISSTIFFLNFRSVLDSLSFSKVNSFIIGLGIIFDVNSEVDCGILEELKVLLTNSEIPYFVLKNPLQLGYVDSLAAALKFCKKEGIYSDRLLCGFVDDDVYLTDGSHYLKLAELLIKDDNFFAVSGLACDRNTGNVLHDFFNLPTDIQIVKRARKRGFSLTRPHIHGGGAGCLMRMRDFNDAVEVARTKNLLLGPAISALGRLSLRKTEAIDGFPVIHPTPSNFYKWLIRVIKYYTTWEAINRYFGFDPTGYYRSYVPQCDSVFKNVLSPYDYQRYRLLTLFRRYFKRHL